MKQNQYGCLREEFELHFPQALFFQNFPYNIPFGDFHPELLTEMVEFQNKSIVKM